MLVVTDLKAIETTEDEFYTRLQHCKFPIKYPSSTTPYEKVEVTVEDIHGRRFNHPKYGEIVIGWSDKVQKLLGIPFEVYDNLQEEITNLTHKNSMYYQNMIGYRSLVKRFQNMSFLQRLYYLFTGKF